MLPEKAKAQKCCNPERLQDQAFFFLPENTCWHTGFHPLTHPYYPTHGGLPSTLHAVCGFGLVKTDMSDFCEAEVVMLKDPLKGISFVK